MKSFTVQQLAAKLGIPVPQAREAVERLRSQGLVPDGMITDTSDIDKPYPLLREQLAFHLRLYNCEQQVSERAFDVIVVLMAQIQADTTYAGKVFGYNVGYTDAKKEGER